MDMSQPTPMNLLTSPAYMWYPGNIYNQGTTAEVVDEPTPTEPPRGDSWIAGAIALAVIGLILLFIYIEARDFFRSSRW